MISNSNRRLCKSFSKGLILALTMWLGFPGGTIAAEAMAVPGTMVTLTPPDGFVPATDFSGFLNTEKQGSLLVAELPAKAMVQLSALFGDQEAAAKAFATKGVTVTERDEVTAANGEAVLLLHGTQNINGTVLDKWIGLYGGERTVLITFQIPQANALDRDILRATFASVSIGNVLSIDEKLSALSFTVEISEPFRNIDSLAGSSVVMMAGSKDVDPKGQQPMIVVAVSQTGDDASDLPATAERYLRQTTGFQSANIAATENVEFAGTKGLITRGTYDDRGLKKTFMHYFGIENGRVIRLIATAETEKFGVLQGSIEQIARSVMFKE